MYSFERMYCYKGKRDEDERRGEERRGEDKGARRGSSRTLADEEEEDR